MKTRPPSASPPGSDTGAERRDRLRFEEAAESPCAACPTTPCCTYLPLGKVHLESFSEVDHARFLLNFNGIELGLSRSGDWRAYFRAPCRFLDSAEAACRLHNAPAQPRICRHYNPYRCWYKRELTGNASNRHLRVDRRRMEALLPMLTFDRKGKLVDVPDWPTLVDTFRELPPQEWPADALPETLDPMDQAWRELALRGERAPAQPSLSYAELGDLCAGCGLHCCRVLMIPHPVPAAASSLDFLRFVLGFPGLALGVADGSWHLIVRTSCRHLADGRCAVFGHPERPVECSYLDAWTCTPRLCLGFPRPEGFLRVTLDLFAWLVEPFRFNPEGWITQLPPVRDLRAHIEARWRDAERDRGGRRAETGTTQLSAGYADK